MWTQIEEVPGLWAAEKRSGAGWHWRASALALEGGGALVVGPVDGLGDEAFTGLEETAGAPAVALAPNHFHWLALPAWRERYPELVIAASAVAARL